MKKVKIKCELNAKLKDKLKDKNKVNSDHFVYAGIDPGKTGAICFILQDGSLEIFDYEDDEAFEMLKYYHAVYDLRVVIEKVWGMRPVNKGPKARVNPVAGVTSNFNFGANYGLWLGALRILGIEYTKAAPVTWQRVIFKGKRADKGSNNKERSRQMALVTFSGASEYLSRKKDHNRADAALIALYGKLSPGIWLV